MSNHSQNPEMIKAMSEAMGLGATGEFPEGKLNPTDEGEIRMAIASEGDKVIIAFGKPTSWIGMGKQQALELAKSIIERAQIL